MPREKLMKQFFSAPKEKIIFTEGGAHVSSKFLGPKEGEKRKGKNKERKIVVECMCHVK